MFADLDETMRQILIEELPVKNGEIDIHFDQPTREWSAKLSKPTLNIFLYDVRENNQLRQHVWQWGEFKDLEIYSVLAADRAESR